MSRLAAPMILAATLVAAAPAALAACHTAPDGSPRYVLAGDTARDTLTGLVWRRCALGTTWDGTTCAGKRLWLGLDAAERAVTDLGPGWRVPDVKELYELLDDACGRPLVDTTAFPDVTAGEGEGDEDHWSTTDAGLGGLWYFVDLAGGIVDGHSRGFSLAVRPVRAGP